MLFEVGTVVDEDEGNSGGKDVVDGRTTPGHLLVTLDPSQHESVALGELAEQYAHRPCRFDEYPQLLGSFCSPVIQPPLSELLGSAQLVKSARI